MWQYDKKLQHPVKIERPNPATAKIIMAQLGGPDGEIAASLRYLSQRYAMPYKQVKGMLTDIGTEELAHMEMISAIIHQLTRNMTPEEIKKSGFDGYFVNHTNGIWPGNSTGEPFTAAYFQSKGDPITDLHEDMAAEQKALATYYQLINLTDDVDLKDILRFLGQREIVHYQRFGEALMDVYEFTENKKLF